ncbi:MAG TPA: elongation factor P, partial [Candidatus Parcubacteria bacterium]|nr:elongation factor P [Candidatus Parcubacteria bacterium]
EIIGPAYIFLKPKESVQAIEFEDKIINIVLPIKVHLKVREAPPGIKGDRSQAGNKIATLETGAQIAVPLFVQEGDIIEVNTERGEYVRRIQ